MFFYYAYVTSKSEDKSIAAFSKANIMWLMGVFFVGLSTPIIDQVRVSNIFYLFQAIQFYYYIQYRNEQKKSLQCFYSKLPHTETEMLPSKRPLLVTYLNPYSIEINLRRADLFERFDFVSSDGILPVAILRLFGRKNPTRISFDMSSMAPVVFDYCVANNKRIYFIGTTQENIETFRDIVLSKYASLNVVGVSSGYFGCDNEKFEEIKSLNPDIVVVGLGSPKQDEFAVGLRDSGYTGTVYTCGGFFHQTTQKIDYYPQWINKLHLRFAYRVYKEPYVLKRLLVQYPRFVVKLSCLCLFNKL